jgi:anionic cell wall polymer biosynthesis LytR-Cps2A-Psr (LCP) family protein
MAQVVTGLTVDYFVAVDFVGFQRLIGQELGGIDVQVAQTMTDNWYPIKGEELNLCGLTNEEIEAAHANFSGFELEQQFPCRFETVSFPAGSVHMQGGDALQYVRSRHGNPGGDFARGVRQQEVLAAIRDKLFTLENVTNIPRVFEQFAAHTQTDLDTKLAEYLWPALKGSRDYEIVRINLSTENVLTSGTSSGGASIIQPRESWEAVQNFVQGQL